LAEAIRLGRLMVELLPQPEVLGLLALMLLNESRRAARTAPNGDLILLDHQDRSLWNREQIAEGSALIERSLSSRRFGPYTIQAAISAVHAESPGAAGKNLCPHQRLPQLDIVVALREKGSRDEKNFQRHEPFSFLPFSETFAS